MPLANCLQEQRNDLVAYELPVIQSRSRLSQWFIDGGMRAGISDLRIRQHTITLYLDKPSFLDALDISDDRTIQVLVVDRSGRVVWRTVGAWDQEREADLVSFLDQQIAHRS
jgi:hypothetical protein